MLERVYSNKRNHEEITSLRMSFNLTLIKKDSKLKCEGMKTLSDFFNQNNEHTKLSPKKMYQCIKENQALHSIIDPKNYDAIFIRF